MTLYECSKCDIHFSINVAEPEACPVCKKEHTISQYEWEARDRKTWFEG